MHVLLTRNLEDSKGLIQKFKSNGSLIELGIDHTEYSHSTKLNELTVKSLSKDFS